MVAVDSDDVAMLGHGPIGAETAFGTEMDRILAPQPLEPRPQRIVAKELGIGDVELFKRSGERLRPGLPGLVRQYDIHDAPTAGPDHQSRSRMHRASAARACSQFQSFQVVATCSGSSCVFRSEARKS